VIKHSTKSLGEKSLHHSYTNKCGSC